MSDEGTAYGTQTKIVVRLAAPVIKYKTGVQTEREIYFEIGQAIHTIQDLYTDSHVERNAVFDIIRFQSYTAQGPGYHKEADIYDVLTSAGKKRQAFYADKAVEYLHILQAAKNNNWPDEQIEQELLAFLALAPDAIAGGTSAAYAPKPNIIDPYWNRLKQWGTGVVGYVRDIF